MGWVFAGFAVLMGMALTMFFTFDQLLKYEYQHHWRAFDADGRPLGFFWRAPESSLFAGSSARGRCAFLWLLQTPPWVAAHPPSVQRIRRLRILWVLFTVGVFVWFFSAPGLVRIS